MYNIGYSILNFTMVAVTLCIVNKFLGTFFDKKKENYLSVIAWFVFGVFEIYVEYNRGTGSIWTTILSIILVFVISIFNCQKSGKTKIFIITLFYAMWSLIEMLVFFCMSIVPMAKRESDIIGAVISKILMIISIPIFSVFWKRKISELISAKYCIALLFIPIGSIYIAVDEFNSKLNDSNTISSMFTFSILLLFNIIIFEIYYKVVENFTYEKERTVYAQQINMIFKNTEEQKKIMEEFYEEKHNLVNELIVLKDSVENNDQINVIDNLKRIIKISDISEQISNSGNNTVDAIINFKYAVSKEQGIEFDLKIFIPEILSFSQCDVGIVLGNALDNAIEAVKECKTHEKVIKISMGIKKKALVLVIKNPYEHILKFDKSENLRTTKKESSRHGYGLNSIRRVAHKYQGIIHTETDDNLFSLTVLMNLEKF